MSKRASLGLVLVLAACLGLYLVGNGRAALWDRDEPWYAQCSRQMLQTGNWVVPMFLDNLRTEKPPLIYWGHVLSMKLFGDSEFAVRFVSSMGMMAVLALLAAGIGRIAGLTRAAWTAFIFGTSALVIAAAKMCLTDAVMMVWIVIAQFCVYAIYRGKGSWKVTAVLGIAIGLGMLNKGPIMLVAPATTALLLALFDLPVLVRSLRNSPVPVWRRATVWLGMALIVLAIMLAIDLPWIYLVHQRAPEWLPRVFKIARSHVNTSMEGHSGPPGYYLLLVWGTFFPWSLLLPTTAVLAWKHRHLPPVRFAIAAVLGPWILQEIIKTKLPHYVLAAYPALAFLTADALVRCVRGQYADLVKPAFIRAAGVWAIVVGFVASLTWLAPLQVKLGGKTIGGGIPLNTLPWGAMIVLSIVGFAYTFGVYACFRKKRPALAAATLGGGMIAIICLFYGWYLPKADFLRLSVQVADVLKKEGAVHRGDVLTVDYKEPSLPYYQGGMLRETGDEDYLLNTSPSQWPRWLVLSSEAWSRVPAEGKAMFTVLKTVRGLNYTGDIRAADGTRQNVINLMVIRKIDSLPRAAGN